MAADEAGIFCHDDKEAQRTKGESMMNTYLQKEENLIAALRSNNYVCFDAVREQGGDRDFTMGILRQMLAALPAYVNAVIAQQQLLPIMKDTAQDTADYQAQFERLDRARHEAHLAAISAIHWLNRVSADHGLEPFAEGKGDLSGSADDESMAVRREIARICIEYCEQLYHLRIGQ